MTRRMANTQTPETATADRVTTMTFPASARAAEAPGTGVPATRSSQRTKAAGAVVARRATSPLVL